MDHFLSFAVFLSSCRNSNLLPVDVCFRFDSFYYLPASSRNYWQHCELKDGIVTKEAKLFLRINCFKLINTTSSTLLFCIRPGIVSEFKEISPKKSKFHFKSIKRLRKKVFSNKTFESEGAKCGSIEFFRFLAISSNTRDDSRGMRIIIF